jgi:hypothetical protein
VIGDQGIRRKLSVSRLVQGELRRARIVRMDSGLVPDEGAGHWTEHLLRDAQRIRRQLGAEECEAVGPVVGLARFVRWLPVIRKKRIPRPARHGGQARNDDLRAVWAAEGLGMVGEAELDRSEERPVHGERDRRRAEARPP